MTSRGTKLPIVAKESGASYLTTYAELPKRDEWNYLN